MDSDREYRGGRVPLPGFGGSYPADSDRRPTPDRRDGIRHVRRVSNLTAAALIVGAGSATVALAHQALPAAAPTTAHAAGAASPGTAAGTGAAMPGATGPRATHSVATTSASGVTTTTTTRIVNGKTVVSHVRHAPAYQDN
jgi:hypothetical protein